VVEISFFPEDKPFSVLIGAIKTSLRTYELFEIAHLFLDKGDRFLVGCRPFDAENDPAAQLYQAVPDQLPFLSESDAVAHVMQRHLELFFTQESVTVDPPKGIFQMVSKCGFTGEILGAPNYHGYQQRLREHHAARLAYLPFEKFTSRIESVRDKEQIDAWLKSMTQITRYTLKDAREGEPTQFDSLESARAFLLASRRDKVVRVVRQMRFPGKFLDTLPSGPLRSAIESELRYQRNFPLATANSLRGRLRKIGLVLYKRGSHEVTYVSAVERKFREPQIRFADSIQRVLDFIEKTPRVKIADLPEKFLGISLAETKAAPANKAGANTPGPEAEATAPQTAPETSPSAELAETQTEQLSVEALVGTASEATAIAPVEISGEAPPTPEAATAAVEDAPAEKVEPASSDETSSADAPAEAAPEAPALPGPEATAVEVSTALAPDSPAPALGAKAGPVPQPTLDLLASNAVRELFKTVRWLVSEGYVTEYSDGRLYAHPVLTEAQIKARTMAVQEPRKHDGKKRGNNTPTAPDVLDALGTADQDEEPTTDQFKTASLES
jgi:hypothetical protein